MWQVLDKKYFLDYPQATMLKVLKAMHQIQVVDSKQVAVSLPGEQIMTPKELANAIREYKKSKGTKDNRVTKQKVVPKLKEE